MRAFVKGRTWLQVNKQQQLAKNVARQSLGRGKVDGERRCHLFIVSRSLIFWKYSLIRASTKHINHRVFLKILANRIFNNSENT